MLVLAIDTAGPACAAAVLHAEGDEAEILAERSEVIGKGHAERLMPMVEAVLAEAGVAFKGLARIAVTTGPGSFTGVRVGVAAARGLALALGIPAVGIGSLEALAAPVARARHVGTVVAVLDARRGEVFARAVDLGTGEELVAATAIAPGPLAARLAGAPRPLVLIGSGAALLLDALAGEGAIAAAPESPAIGDVGRLALGAATHPPAPFYARDADAKPQAGKAVARQ